MPGGGGLRDDDLSMSNPEISEFKAIGIEGPFARLNARVVVSSNPAEDMHRQSRAEQA